MYKNIFLNIYIFASKVFFRNLCRKHILNSVYVKRISIALKIKKKKHFHPRKVKQKILRETLVKEMEVDLSATTSNAALKVYISPPVNNFMTFRF